MFVRSGPVRCQLETIHPFLDGNGRLGWLIAVLFLVQQELPRQQLLHLSACFDAHRSEHCDRLQAVREKGARRERTSRATGDGIGDAREPPGPVRQAGQGRAISATGRPDAASVAYGLHRPHGDGGPAAASAQAVRLAAAGAHVLRNGLVKVLPRAGAPLIVPQPARCSTR